jgi:integrase
VETGLQFLYPSEFLTFVNSPKVPLRWRRLVALAVYSYQRDGELRVIECGDADTEHMAWNVSKSLSKTTGETVATKGLANRSPPIEPAIVALLEAMKAEQKNTGPLVPTMPSERDMARGLRRWLAKAGVKRHELHHATPTTRPIRFHDLRATGLTWMAVRGDDAIKIQRRAGHKDLETTLKYIRLAEDLNPTAFGDVFPKLPSELYEVVLAEESIRAIDQTPPSTRNYLEMSGADGTRTRGLRRDRPAL